VVSAASGGEEMQKSFVGFEDYGRPVRLFFSNISVLVDWAYWPKKFLEELSTDILFTVLLFSDFSLFSFFSPKK